MPVIAQRSDIVVSEKNLLMISGIPFGKLDGDSLEIIDDNKFRSLARGGKVVRVKLSHIIQAIQHQRSIMQS